MEIATFLVRPATEADLEGWLDLFEAVAGEGIWIGRELPIDRDEQRQRFQSALFQNDGPTGALIAESEGHQVGQLGLQARVGIGEIGMAVDARWRGRGVGSALLAAAIDWARRQGLHKLALQVWPHNEAAQRLYQEFGFVPEGRLHRHYRRRNGELWDAIVMGLVLDESSPGSPL